MRKSRYQKGSVKKQHGRWVAMWWVDRKRKSRVLGLVRKISKSEARAAVDRTVQEVNARRERHRVWSFAEFVNEVYVPYYSRKWKQSTRENNVNRVSVHLVSRFGDRGSPASGGMSFRVCWMRRVERVYRSPSSIIYVGT